MASCRAPWASPPPFGGSDSTGVAIGRRTQGGDGFFDDRFRLPLDSKLRARPSLQPLPERSRPDPVLGAVLLLRQPGSLSRSRDGRAPFIVEDCFVHLYESILCQRASLLPSRL